MNKLEKILQKWNFKKIAVWYLVLAVLAGVACAVTVGCIYKERLNFAWQYSRLEKAANDSALKAAAQKTADASADVVDVLILNKQNQVTYSAKNSEFGAGTLELTRLGSNQKYLTAKNYPAAVFQFVKSEEFMLNSIMNKDFGKIRTDYDDDSAFETSLAEKNIYMLSRVGIRGGSKAYVITVPTTVPGGLTALKGTAALAMLFFCVYWVLLALWLYKDAAACKLPPLYWGLIGLFTNLIGFIVYKIYKRSLTVCPACGAAQSADHQYCSLCGKQLGEQCERCGCKVEPKASYCHRCGNKIK